MRIIQWTMLALFCNSFLFLQAQTGARKAKGPNDFPDLIMTKIKGAPLLGKPMLIMGDEGPLIAEGMGWAAPAFFDWDGDGKRDLLIGEFASGIQNPDHQNAGNFVRVYFNKGTDTVPEFVNDFQYARSEFGQGNGMPMSVYTWCCLGFTPQVVDLNNDGVPDIVTGQYCPGLVTWFKGVKKTEETDGGFLPGVLLKQEGDEEETGIRPKDLSLPTSDIKGPWYWNYAAVSFGDLDGDGDFDMVVGGTALRMSENIGTKEEPKFGYRKLLLDTFGNPLKMSEHPIPEIEDLAKQNINVPESGSMNMVPLVVDWDNDGVLDILATDVYCYKGSHAIVFFKGVKTANGLRFEPGVPLFTVKDDGKAFPGSWLRLWVTDWNHDGINDLLIGTSVATLHGGKFDYDLSWTWEDETKILKKSPAYDGKEERKLAESQIAAAPEKSTTNTWTKQRMREQYYGKGNYRSLAHKGFVYLMLGKKNNP